jgi:hypothetical protein
VTLDISDHEQTAALERALPDSTPWVNKAGVVVAGPPAAVPPAELLRTATGVPRSVTPPPQGRLKAWRALSARARAAQPCR